MIHNSLAKLSLRNYSFSKSILNDSKNVVIASAKLNNSLKGNTENLIDDLTKGHSFSNSNIVATMMQYYVIRFGVLSLHPILSDDRIVRCNFLYLENVTRFFFSNTQSSFSEKSLSGT
jgi:hypothetical protein